MKRALSLSTLFLLLILASCEMPLGNLEPGSQDQLSPDPTPSGLFPGVQAIQPDSLRRADWRTFIERQEDTTWTILWNERTGLPRSIAGGRTRAYPGDSEAAARAFLTEYRTLFGMKNQLSDLQRLETTENRYGLRRVTFQQYFNGIPVEDAQYKVQMDAGSRVLMANGIYYPDIQAPATPAVTAAGAVVAAKADLGLVNPDRESSTAELVVLPLEEGTFALAWKTIVFAEEPFTDWLYFIDARSGNVLEKQDRIMDVTGSGDVYPTHPFLSSVTNKNLYRLSGNGYLQGTYAYVVNDDGSEAYSGSHSYQYGPSNTHFDEVNLYYHIDDFRHNFIEGLGSPGFTQITAHAHATHPVLGDANAWFSPSNQDLYFGDAASSGSYNDFAKEDKVIYHEYGHAVIYDIESDIFSSADEEGAISEGVPDYWAGAHTGRSKIGEYVGSSRNMNIPFIDSYSDYIYERENVPPIEEVPAHVGGEFFSAILWDLRGRINASQADFLVYDAIDGVGPNPKFRIFRDAMITSDQAAYSGANSATIDDTFADWEITDPVFVDISGTYDLSEEDEYGYWDADAWSGTPPYSYQWESKVTCRSGYWCYQPGQWNPAGTSQTLGWSWSESIAKLELRVMVTDDVGLENISNIHPVWFEAP